MNVVVPCECGKDLIENSGDNPWTTFSPYKVNGDFYKRSRADNSVAHDRIWLNFELIRNNCMLLFLASMEKIQLKIAKIMRAYKVYGNFFKRSRADNSACGRIWLNFKLN